MNAIGCLCVLLFILNFADADSYEIPLTLLHNEFTDKLLRRVVLDINRRLNDDHLIFDVPRARTQLRDVLQYEFELVLMVHNCKNIMNKKAITFAECKEVVEKFKLCKTIVHYTPWNNTDEDLVVTDLYCKETIPSIPNNPYFLGYSLPANVKNLFMAFQQKHRRHYSKEEAMKRFAVFKRNLLKIKLFQDLDKGTAEYGITAFADLDEEEFKRTHANLKTASAKKISAKIAEVNEQVNMPHSFDWREKGAVTEVKDQGFCGSCWAFGTVGNIETQWYLKHGTLTSLSEQQLLDCDHKDEACNGGLPEWAFPTIIKMGGLMSESDYPYEAHEEDSCHLVKDKISARIDDWSQLPQDENKLAAWLAQNGTITVGINANFLQFYFGGISHPPHIFCSSDGLDHAVLLVGYGVSSILARPYWIVKNSWGSSWGESGYFRLYRGDGTCGINTDATTSLIY